MKLELFYSGTWDEGTSQRHRYLPKKIELSPSIVAYLPASDYPDPPPKITLEIE